MAVFKYEFSSENNEEVVLELDTDKVTDGELEALLTLWEGAEYLLEEFEGDVRKAALSRIAISILYKAAGRCLNLSQKLELHIDRWAIELDGSTGIKLISYDSPEFDVTCDKVTEVFPSAVEEEETGHE